MSDEQAAALGLEWETFRYLVHRGHLLRCRDKSAAARYYGPRKGAKKTKFWVGSYFMPAVCDFFGAPAAIHFFSADIQEQLGVPELDRRLQRALGRKPESYTFDAAFANTSIYKHNTTQGIATITPGRRLPGGKSMQTARCDEYDEHGVVRCKYCGGPTVPSETASSFAIQAGDPRLRVRCLLRHTDECTSKIQTISCSKHWRLLAPMSRLDTRFHDLLRAHKTTESVFDSWRDRYAVAGTTQSVRSKRRGHRAAQELRASVALLAEWYRICLRHGYIGNHARRNQNQPRQRDEGDFAVRQLRDYRRENLLDLPYGSAARALGLVGVWMQTDVETGAVEPPDDPNSVPF